MKDIHYHLINAAIAGGLVLLGSLSSLISGVPTEKEIITGVLLAVLTGTIIFLNKFQEWFSTQDPPKIFQFI